MAESRKATGPSRGGSQRSGPKRTRAEIGAAADVRKAAIRAKHDAHVERLARAAEKKASRKAKRAAVLQARAEDEAQRAAEVVALLETADAKSVESLSRRNVGEIANAVEKYRKTGGAERAVSVVVAEIVDLAYGRVA